MHGIGNGPSNLDHSSIWQMIQFLYLCPKKATKQASNKGELQTFAPKDKKQSKEELVDVMLRLELLIFLIKLRQDNESWTNPSVNMKVSFNASFKQLEVRLRSSLQ